MDKNILAVSNKMHNQLDDEYTLYEDGLILHKYDENIYPGGFNLVETLTVDQIDYQIKERLYAETSTENKENVRIILKL
jgi:hypothetical protein